MFGLIIFGSLIGVVCNIGVGQQQVPEPHTGYRRFGQELLSKLANCLAFVMGYLYIKKKGKLASSEEAPVVVIAPHFSFMDGIFCVAIGHLTYISRDENNHVPIFGHMVRLLQPISVKRSKRSAKEETVKEILRRARAKGRWSNICVFPEGTTTNGQSLITFKPGAFLAGVPVQPVIFRYPKDAIAWTWIAPPTLHQIAYILSNINNQFEIEFLPVYKPNEEEKQNPILFANNVRKIMAEALDVPTSEHSYEDCWLMQEAISKGLPMEAGLVEYYKVNADLGINFEKLKELLGRFAQIDSNKDGYITFNELAQYMNDSTTERVRWIFNRIDQVCT